MVDIEMLWKLQQLENKIVDVEKDMGIPELILEIDHDKDHYNRLLQGTKKIAVAYKEKDATAKEVKDEVDEIRDKIAHDEELFNSGEVIKPKALSQLEKDIEDSTKLIEEKESTLHQLKKENIANIKQIKRLKSKLEEMSEHVDSSTKRLKQLKKEAKESLTTVYERIEVVNEQLTPETARFYNEKKDSLFPVLVPYNGDSCEGCKMQFSLMFIQDIEKNEKRSCTCENCGRIIIIPNTQEA